MRIRTIGFGLLTLALSLSAVAPASAEFFGCNDQRGKLLYSYKGTPSAYDSRSYSRRATSDFATPSRRHYQAHATYYSSRRSWDDRSRW